MLNSAARWLDSSESARFGFVSSDSALHLKDIVDQLRRHDGTATEFVRVRVDENAERRRAFDDLAAAWGLDPRLDGHVDRAINRLRRMSFIVHDRSGHGRDQLRLTAAMCFAGDPDVALDAIERFLVSHLTKKIGAALLLTHLEERGIVGRTLARSPGLPSEVRRLSEEYEAQVAGRLIRGSWIIRPEADRIAISILGEQPPRLVIVHGGAGAGKSSILLGLCARLRAQGLAVLPISLVTHPPAATAFAYGQQLGLGSSPAAALRGVSGGNRCALIVDQFDSLRLAHSEAAAAWQRFQSVLGEALGDPQMTLVVACRTFDLNNDPQIRQWKEAASAAGGVLEVKIGDLEPREVAGMVDIHKPVLATLPQRLQQLLRHAGTLKVWTALSQRGVDCREAVSATSLMSALIDTLRREVVHLHGQSESEVQGFLEAVRRVMESSGQASVAKRQLPNTPVLLSALCAVGLLIEMRGRVGFPHQSYLDYMIADSALRESGAGPSQVLQWLRVDQSLHRREQLRHLLALIRDGSPAEFVGVAEAILADESTRFHLKLIVLGTLQDQAAPVREERCLVGRLTDDSEWWPHVRDSVLAQSITWFDVAVEEGWWVKWLKDADAIRREDVCRLLNSVMSDRPVEVDRCVASAGPLDDRDMQTLAGFDPANDSPGVCRWRSRRIRGDRDSGGHLGSMVVGLNSPSRAFRLISDLLRGAIRQIRKGLEPGDVASGIDAALRERFILHMIGQNGIGKWTRVRRLTSMVEGLLSGLRATVAKSQEPSRYHFTVQRVLSEIGEILVTVASQLVRGLAGREPGQLQWPMSESGGGRLAIAVASGLAEAPTTFADDAIVWLCDEPARFVLRRHASDSATALAARVLSRHLAHCSPGTLERLESQLLGLFPKHEKDGWRRTSELCRGGCWGYSERGHYRPVVSPWGRAQYNLLSTIPEGRRSSRVHERVAAWHTKFASVRNESADDELLGGWVRSPIPAERLHLVSDSLWKSMSTRNWDPWRRRQIGPDQVSEMNHELFARDFGNAAKKNPARFVALGSKLPEEAPAVYLASLLHSLADSEVDSSRWSESDVSRIFRRVGASGDSDSLMCACRFLAAHPRFGILEEAWSMLAIAAAHPSPEPGYSTIAVGEGDSAVSDIETTGLNCVRGCAAACLGGLARHRRDYVEQALQLGARLLQDPHASVRCEAIAIAAGAAVHDRARGISVFLSITGDGDARILASHRARQLIAHFRWHRPGSLDELFRRMLDSDDSKVIASGSRWITAEWHQQGRLEEMYRECEEGSSAHRRGVAKCLRGLSSVQLRDRAAWRDALCARFVDDDKEVRHAAVRVFWEAGTWDSEEAAILLGAFVGSPAFGDEARAVVWHINSLSLNLLPLRDAVLDMAGQVAAQVSQQPRWKWSEVLAAASGISKLIFKLYDQAERSGQTALATRCLDLWDLFLKTGIGEAERQLNAWTGQRMES
ncbi:MAG: hypothetical protein IT434_08155 [Phycisphaerales bacterium]|nr:hypothetical protein [Phycisphaerales bacterium]